MSDTIRVLIVDDSSFKREALRSILNSSPAIEVVGMAKDGKEGVEKAFEMKPDVITMDIRMPVMSGLDAIERIMQEHPTPIIVVSGMDVRATIKALDVGAMDFVAEVQDINELASSIIEKVRAASKVRPMRRMRMDRLQIAPRLRQQQFKVVAIGISTGGPQALGVLLSMMPKESPISFLIVQHISDGFIDGLAQWLQGISELKVKVAKAGERIEKGCVYLAPDHCHMVVDKDEKIFLKDEKALTAKHIPSIDEMMFSIVDVYGNEAIGIIMTGMGVDGVEGIKAIKKAGGFAIAQDEKSSIIFGMNKMAIEKKYVDAVISLDKIANEIIRRL